MGHAEQFRVCLQWVHINPNEAGQPQEAQNPHELAGISELQEKDLRELFELYGMEQNYVELIAQHERSGLGGARIKRCLKVLNLKRGNLTELQVGLIQLELYLYRGTLQ